MKDTIPEKHTLQLSQNDLQTILVALHTLCVVSNTEALDVFRVKVIDDANRFFTFPDCKTSYSDEDVGPVADVVFDVFYDHALCTGQPITPSENCHINLDLSAYVVQRSLA